MLECSPSCGGVEGGLSFPRLACACVDGFALALSGGGSGTDFDVSGDLLGEQTPWKAHSLVHISIKLRWHWVPIVYLRLGESVRLTPTSLLFMVIIGAGLLCPGIYVLRYNSRKDLPCSHHAVDTTCMLLGKEKCVNLSLAWKPRGKRNLPIWDVGNSFVL
eukprot:4957434-Amphidinium_carterae.1